MILFIIMLLLAYLALGFWGSLAVAVLCVAYRVALPAIALALLKRRF